MDALSLLLHRFSITAGVFYTGRICGANGFAADVDRGHLHIIEQGPIVLVDSGGTSRRIEKPTLLFMPRPEQHRLIADEAVGAKVVCGTVQFGGGNNNPISDSLPALVVVELEHLEGTTCLLSLIAQEAFGERAGAQAAIDRICELLIIRVLRHCLNCGLTTGGALAGLTDPRLAKVLAAIHREPTRAWGLEDMAAIAGLSRARFAARFREVTGLTPSDYLAGWRITLAQNMLMSGRAMKQVSAESGYGSSSAFIRAFVRKVGMPPTQWLKQAEHAAEASGH